MRNFLLSCLFLATTSFGFSQLSFNVSLFGQLDPEPIHYAGCWHYVDSQGNEYGLVGAFNGTSIVDIDDSTNLFQADWVDGPPSNWREYTVVGDYAYVVSEGSGGTPGMQVIDLSYLPDSVSHITTFDSTFTTAHMIQKDVLGNPNYVYVSGSNAGGTHFIDISDPANPKEVGAFHPHYVHDMHVRGDTLYMCAFSQGWVDVVDISNKQNPVTMAQITYPNPRTHSCWTTPDNTHLVVCDEQDGLVSRIFDITDLQNVSQVATYSANLQSLVHNPYIKGDFVFYSHNTEGLRVVDIADPAIPVEVGYYDTWPGSSGGFNGLWSADPFLPSGKIIGGNRHDGLYVFKFNGTQAGRIYGTVIDSVTQLPIPGALIDVQQTTTTKLSNAAGEFSFGELPNTNPGYDLAVSANGYNPKTVNVILNPGDSLALVVELVDTGFVNIDLPAPNEIELFPNPASDLLRLRVSQAVATSGYNLALYNVKGKLISRSDEFFTTEREIDLRDLSSGMYFYRVRTGNLLLKAGKLIVD